MGFVWVFGSGKGQRRSAASPASFASLFRLGGGAVKRFLLALAVRLAQRVAHCRESLVTAAHNLAVELDKVLCADNHFFTSS